MIVALSPLFSVIRRRSSVALVVATLFKMTDYVTRGIRMLDFEFWSFFVHGHYCIRERNRRGTVVVRFAAHQQKKKFLSATVLFFQQQSKTYLNQRRIKPLTKWVPCVLVCIKRIPHFNSMRFFRNRSKNSLQQALQHILMNYMHFGLMCCRMFRVNHACSCTEKLNDACSCPPRSWPRLIPF